MITGLGDLEVGDDKDKNLSRMNVEDGRVGKRQSYASFQEASGSGLGREERYMHPESSSKKSGSSWREERSQGKGLVCFSQW